MMETPADVLLISSDPRLAEVAQRQRPRDAKLVSVSDPGQAVAAGQARQLWIDLDTTEVAALPEAERRVYFYSRQAPDAATLPPGMFIRKPCAPIVFEVLWADAARRESGHAAAETRPLPPWIMDFHDIRLKSLCRKMITGLAPRLGYRDVSLYLHEFHRELLTLAETTHTRTIEATVPMDAPGQHLMVAVARSGRVFRTEHTPEELAVRGIRARTDRAYVDDCCLVAPLCSEGDVWGVLNFSGRAPTALTEADLPLDELFAFLGRALHHAQAYEAARTEARVDGLTGLFNQRWMMESLAREIRRAERFRSPLAAIMLDLDGLKSINDRDGHAAGDCVLRHVASRITSVLRQFDGAARVGGDEFIVMLPATNLRGAQRVARRLLESIRSDPAHFGDAALPVTASLGAAEWQTGWNAQKLLEAADRAMYRAKHGGRNACAAPDEPATPTVSRRRPTRTC